MKTSILFVMNKLTVGGAEKALISLLETIDYSKYDVDLFLFKHEGLFMNKLPPQVHVLPEPPLYSYFDMSIKKAIMGALKKGKPLLAIFRVLVGYIFRTDKRPAVREQRSWKYVSHALPKLTKNYHVAIGYLEKNPIYYIIDKVNADRKLGYVHNDYNKLGMDPELDKKYFAKLDFIITVSEECGSVLKVRFPQYEDKVRVIQNIVSAEVIQRMAAEKAEWNGNGDAAFRIVSVGRLNEQKGFDLAVEACKLLRDAGFDLKWYVIGEGEERGKLEALIKLKGLENNFILLGLRENPYPYVKEADVYVQPSRFEGKSIAIDEAKILHKPVVVTDFSTARDQIASECNGIIVKMNAQAISEGVRRLLEDAGLRAAFASRLAEEHLGTESEIKKLYRLF
ncbi:Glycosyltransferase involved in cell wall bisynthesis [Cohnella sp. OV330]|uniref:glycosyltransferase n=1 Tax=Cohnella sp. OV330 TaxID=1855288 RepID=UPI0008E5E705|nr:glycosyltransferase [Cohnella sp. OV330]SFB29882.1 Glycosyltransferase involved in cell wall bisynthesis [Cohnella sp. OV330]